MHDADDMEEIILEFLEESLENLDRLDREFLELEADPTSRETLSSIFRTIHTIKGTSGLLAFNNLAGVTHIGENLLSALREGSLALTPQLTDLLLEMVDAVRDMLGCIETSRNDGTERYEPLIARISAALPGASEAAPVDEVATTVAEATESTPELASIDAEQVPEVASADDEPDVPSSAGVSATLAVDPSIRVGVRLLDRLMNLVGELVLARNQILQFGASQDDSTFLATSQQLNLITTELQESVMKTRMQPISGIWSKLPRVVRDLAHSCDKEVKVVMEGQETELDKTILEAIKDPLTHVLRNAVDHGIEAPATRIAAGKSPEGTIRLRAFHEGGQVVIEIHDDGAGINLDAVKAKAIERGLTTAAQAARMSDQAAANLIFLPGFSTAAAVTNVSGRGVGMDVVKTNIEKIGGVVDLQFVPGQSTTLTARIPLTLAIIPALVITCETNRYLIPQVNLVELLRIEQASKEIEFIGGAPVYRLRGKLLPIVHLREILGAGCSDASNTDDAYNIVVLQADGRQFGLVVDDICDTEEIVVKPLGRHLKTIGAFTGTTIMGDGSVALILDTIGIASAANIVSETNERIDLNADSDPNDRRDDSTTAVIVCRVGDQRVAMPLAMVDRLEELSSELVETTSGQRVIQYRERLLHLVPLGEILNGTTAVGAPPKLLQVLVYATGSNLYGLVVDEIVDIVDADLRNTEPATNPFVQGATVIGRRVTDLVHIDEVIAAHTAGARRDEVAA